MTALATASTPAPSAPLQAPTVWGMDASQLHARFWAARGVQVVRQGEPSEIVPHAELYLLCDHATLAIFRIGDLAERIAWSDAELLTVRLSDSRDLGYRERVVTDAHGKFSKFKRVYGSGDSRFARVALTPDREIARAWQAAPDPRTGWRRLRRNIHRAYRWSARVKGKVFDLRDHGESAAFARELVARWNRPDMTVHGVRAVGNGSWAHQSAGVDPASRLAGALWIGAGRRIGAGVSAVGPGILWDDPAHRPEPEEIRWLEIEPAAPPDEPRVKRSGAIDRALKRGFDLAFASLAMLATAPLYPIIMLAILIEDGRPFFFSHKRETLHGREFGCVKFRSMRKDAEKIKAQLMAQNKADGPQFFMEKDPRLTRVGAFLRKVQLDEIPQFWNVIRGDMSVVGPRPSPHAENQFCPAWREARLSVRPGVTGLWQIRRTRVEGTDFQEWIKYDIEYVEKRSFGFDLYIIFKTIELVIRGVLRA